MILSFRRIVRGLGLLIVAPTVFALWLSCSVALVMEGVRPKPSFVEVMGMVGIMLAGAAIIVAITDSAVKFGIKLWKDDAKITLWGAKTIPEARALNKDSSHVKS